MHDSSRIRTATRHRGPAPVCDTGAGLGADREAAADACLARREVLDERPGSVRHAEELTMLNAANLCPSSGPVLETMYRMTKDMDQDPSFENRAKLGDGRENTRKLLAEFLRVTPEEIVITRNTSESNNLVSTGIELKAGDESC